MVNVTAQGYVKRYPWGRLGSHTRPLLWTCTCVPASSFTGVVSVGYNSALADSTAVAARWTDTPAV